jgi:osmotically-inducible protein OsmY
MFNFFKKTDAKIQEDVTSELRWTPSVTADQITVTAKDGVVTLSGSVPHYFEKNSAEEAAQRVGGVSAVADELEVNLMGSYERSDSDMATAALNALDWNYAVPEGIKVTVDRAWVTLKGEVEWDYERNAAKDAIAPLMGVRGVTNEITLKKRVQSSDVKTRIEDALKRSAESEGREIKVAVDGSKVTLSGNVHSYSEIEDARLAAWGTPGVMTVESNLKFAA